jgi:hypothetical protein
MSRICLSLVFLSILSACSTPPLRIDYQTNDQVSICRNTETMDFQDAEDLAAQFCSARGMLPRLAGTDRCSRKSVRYNYVCTAPHY